MGVLKYFAVSRETNVACRGVLPISAAIVAKRVVFTQQHGFFSFFFRLYPILTFVGKFTARLEFAGQLQERTPLSGDNKNALNNDSEKKRQWRVRNDSAFFSVCRGVFLFRLCVV